MISIFTAVAATVWVLRSFAANRAFMFVALFLSWQFALKIYGVTYLDVFGPIYSDEVFTEVGGIGASAPLMALFVMIPLVAIKIAFTRFSSRHPPLAEPHLESSRFTFADLVVVGLALFTFLLYADMIRLGTVPLFERLERFEYKGGIFHQILVNYTFMIAYVIGFCVARERILTGVWDLRFGMLILIIFVYLLLAGHRFGSFYVLVTFALLPMAALYVAPKLGLPLRSRRKVRSILQRLMESRATIAIFGLVLAGIVLSAMFNSLFNVRDTDGTVGDELLQRFLVQPVHLYWLTWERLQNNEIQDLAGALDFVFNNPFDAARNTGIQYLMFLHLGQDRASQVFEVQGVDYAGGYPEILTELGGLGLALPASVLASIVVALLYRAAIVAVVRGHFFSSVLALYVCFGFIGLFLGGMVNFLTAEIYWLKIIVLISAVGFERALDRRGRRLLPWVLIRRRARRVPLDSGRSVPVV